MPESCVVGTPVGFRVGFLVGVGVGICVGSELGFAEIMTGNTFLYQSCSFHVSQSNFCDNMLPCNLSKTTFFCLSVFLRHKLYHY